MESNGKIEGTNTKKPSKILITTALIFSLLLPYYLVNKFSGKNNTNHIDRSLSLPSQSVKHISTDNSEWTSITTRERDTLSSILKRAEISPESIKKIINDKHHIQEIAYIKPNQQVQLLINNTELERLIIPISPTKSLEYFKEDNKFNSRINNRKIETHEHYLTATVKNSLYSTAKEQKIPYNLISQMTDIFDWEIDFTKDIRDGDRFTIIYKAQYVENQLIGAGEIIAVTLTNRGVVHKAIRHISPSGQQSFYTPDGRSLKKAFNRYPLRYSHISSMFSFSRNHPILHKHRPHKGVDLAAPIGTPIHATGDGKIESITHQDGYGNMIKISHNKNYTTVYAHMLKFQKGLARGDRVKRDQVIGYVGQSGLATGPHLHYEFHLNHTPKNPITVDLPRSESIQNSELAEFKMLSTTILSHLNLYEEAHIAANSKFKRDFG